MRLAGRIERKGREQRQVHIQVVDVLDMNDGWMDDACMHGLNFLFECIDGRTPIVPSPIQTLLKNPNDLCSKLDSRSIS